LIKISNYRHTQQLQNTCKHWPVHKGKTLWESNMLNWTWRGVGNVEYKLKFDRLRIPTKSDSFKSNQLKYKIHLTRGRLSNVIWMPFCPWTFCILLDIYKALFRLPNVSLHLLHHRSTQLVIKYISIKLFSA
jgi:hypothetical protein